MNYKNIYEAIILKYKKLNLQKLNKYDINYIYLETHHIIPKCICGTNDKDNLVNLPAREHFICHLLLAKIYKGTKFELPLWTAAFRFIYGNNIKNNINFKINSRAYKIIKENYCKLLSIKNRGSNNPNFGKTMSIENRKKLSILKKGKSLEQIIGKERADIAKRKMSESQKKREHRKGFKHSLETRQKMSLSQKGKKKPETFKIHISQRMKGNTYGHKNKGRKMSKEFCEKISKAKIGKPSPNKGRKNWFKQTEEVKKRISESLKALHKKCSKETKQKMSERAKELRNKKVLCIETGMIYKSYMSAAFKTKIKNIGRCCLGKVESAGGYHWKFL